MPLPKVNPLDSYVTSKPGSFPRDFKIPKMPSIAESIPGNGIKGGLADALAGHDQKMEEWRKTFESSIAERLREGTTTNTETKTVTNLVSSPAAQAVAPSATDQSELDALQAEIDDIKVSILPSGNLGSNNFVAVGTSAQIPSGWSLIFSGPFTVEGILVVEGILQAL